MSDIKASPPRTFLDRLLRGLLILAVVLAAVYGAAILVVDAQVRGAAERATADGQATLDISAYIPPPEIPEDVANGTDALEAASLLSNGQRGTYIPREGGPTLARDIQEVYGRLRDLDKDGKPPTPEDLDTFRAMLENRALVAQAIDRAVEAERARYRTNFDDVPAAMIIPNLLTRLRFAGLLRARAEVALAEGRTADAWADAAKIFRLAHLTNESLPTLINMLVARAVAYHGFALTQTLLGAAPPELDDAARALRRRVAEEAHRIDPAEVLSTRLGGERAAIYATLLDPRATPEILFYLSEAENTEQPPFATSHPLLRRVWTRRQAASYLDAATPTFDLCRKPTYTMDNPRQTFDALKPTSGYLATIWFDCLETAHKRDLWIAYLDQLDIALRLEEVRAETGEYPETLAGIDDGKIDLFTGEPYRYHREANGYVLYSVSINGVDDGGVRPPKNEQGSFDNAQGDLVWRVAHGA